MHKMGHTKICNAPRKTKNTKNPPMELSHFFHYRITVELLQYNISAMSNGNALTL